MIVTLEFELPDDETEFQLAINAGNMHSMLYDVAQQLRNAVKYGSPEKYEEVMRECSASLMNMLDQIEN